MRMIFISVNKGSSFIHTRTLEPLLRQCPKCKYLSSIILNFPSHHATEKDRNSLPISELWMEPELRAFSTDYELHGKKALLHIEIHYIYVCVCVFLCVCMYMYVCMYIYIYIYIYTYIQSWPKLSAPLVNMIKGGCENESALLILLIFYLKNWQKSNLSLENKNLKWEEISLWNKCFSLIHIGHN